jgi:CRP-like cAMP-binding protein
MSRQDDSLPQGAHRNDPGNRLLAALPREAFAFLQRDMKQVALAQGVVLLEPGDAIDRVYFPQGGMISLLVISSEGALVETATVGREGAVGLHRGLGKRFSFTRAIVQMPARCFVIPADRFEDAAREHPAVRDVVARYTEILWAEAQQLVACNAIHDASNRLCRWLLHCADRIGSDVLPVTQDFLSQMLGVRRTTVTLLAQALQQKGAIAYRRGRIAITDRRILEACSCECYRAIRQEALPSKIGVSL